jgi:5'-3' exonuclease
MKRDPVRKLMTQEAMMTRPLLVVDGDSFAHRAYHALPKTIRRRDNKGAGAIVGFANFLLRLYENERPRAVLVGWDTLEAPTYRHRAFADYQAGRHIDAELCEQLEVLPQFVIACGFACAKAPGYEAASPPPSTERSAGAGKSSLRLATAIAFSLPPTKPRFFSP